MPPEAPQPGPPPQVEAEPRRAVNGWVGAKSTWVAMAVAAASVVGVAAFVAIVCNEIGDTDLSLGGWIAMIFGIVATLALGIGLMSLVFISSRRGYDETGGDWR